MTEWLDTPKVEYHERQLIETYRSTVHFFDWLERLGHIKPDSSFTVLELASGRGANISYMAKRYPKCFFHGIELNPDHVKRCNEVIAERKVENAIVERGDWYNLDKKLYGAFDAVISLQTLSWLPEFSAPLAVVCKLNPKWQAHSSLFYDGLVGATTETQTYDEKGKEKRKLFYNVYPIPVVAQFLAKRGYVNFVSEYFEIDVDIEKTGEFRSYTERTEDGRRIQISGPVLMPWHFVAATRGDQ